MPLAITGVGVSAKEASPPPSAVTVASPAKPLSAASKEALSASVLAVAWSLQPLKPPAAAIAIAPIQVARGPANRRGRWR
jgi:hypothetical protein